MDISWLDVIRTGDDRLEELGRVIKYELERREKVDELIAQINDAMMELASIVGERDGVVGIGEQTGEVLFVLDEQLKYNEDNSVTSVTLHRLGSV